MIDRFYKIRSIRDVRSAIDAGVYFAKYMPATAFLAYTLHLEAPHQLSGFAGIFAAWAIVIFGVEARAGMRGFAANRQSRRGSESSSTPFLNR